MIFRQHDRKDCSANHLILNRHGCFCCNCFVQIIDHREQYEQKEKEPNVLEMSRQD